MINTNENNIPSGYKKTEVGVIPEDWWVKTYDEVFDFLATATYSRAELTEFDNVRYVHYGDIHTKWNFFLDIKQSNLPTIRDKQVKNYHLLKDGDVIMADASEDYSGIGKCVEVKNLGSVKAISGLHTFLFRDKNEVFVNGFRGYIHYIKVVKTQFDRLATGLKVYGVSKGNLKTVKIPVPTKAEQTAIATALSDADALISSLEKLIEKKRAIKQGAMQQLLKPKKGWVVKKLGEVAESASGGTPLTSQSSYYNGNIPWAVIADITSAGKYISDTEKKISVEGLKNSSAKLFKKGTLLFAMYASIGKCTIATMDTSCNQAILGIQTKSIITEFLYYYLSFNELRFLRMGQTGTQSNLSKEIVEDLDIPYPPTSEQQQISTILSDIDTEIITLEIKLKKQKMIKQGMMQNLLTGKIRLV